ncbi:MAG: gliding motility protein GldM [Bacteroidota bacterium]
MGGHGKETPRQKMIGMMYLVLTAMLALNVSAEVLDAFRLVNEGIKNTTQIFSQKNETIYKEFEAEVAKNEKKAREWKNRAFDVREQADELYDYIQDLKVTIVKKNQGKNIEENEALTEEEGKILVDQSKVTGENKTSKTTSYLVGNESNGKAYDLKEKLNEYRENLLEMVSEEDKKVINAISSSLDTSDPPASADREQQKSWEIKHFYEIPLGAILPILSKIQADVRNAESEMIQYLFNQIEAGSFSFNKLEATVIPNSNNIIRGNNYKAEVFLAARDTTAPPEILIGEWDSVRKEDGSYEVEMTQIDDSLDITGGKGMFEKETNQSGSFEWGGIIKLMGPDGNYIKKPFKREYQVSPPNVVISPTKMNVFYVGIPNPVSISIPGIPAEDVRPTMTNGTISKVGPGNYQVKPNSSRQNCVVRVEGKVDGEFRSYGNQEFRVKDLPTPTAQVAGKSGGDIDAEELELQSGVFARMEDFLFDLNYEVTQFTVTTTDKGGYFQDLKKDGYKFDDEVITWIKNNVSPGRKVNFEDIKAVGPDGKAKDLNPITFTVK